MVLLVIVSEPASPLRMPPASPEALLPLTVLLVIVNLAALKRPPANLAASLLVIMLSVIIFLLRLRMPPPSLPFVLLAANNGIGENHLTNVMRPKDAAPTAACGVISNEPIDQR